MKNSLVSIIIPSYNRANIIHETLNSVINQTYSNWECIIVDDGSTDNTISVVEGYCEKDNRFKSYSRPEYKFKGPSSCRNYGVERANGECIIFLDSDDLLAPFCLQERVKAFETNKECDFLVFQMEVFKNDKPNFIKKINEFNLTKADCLKSFIYLQSAWQITSPIYKKVFLIDLEGFSEKLLVYEDFELATKAIMKSNQFKIYKSVDCYYRNNELYFTKQKDLDFVKRIIQSFENYCQIFHNEIIFSLTNDNQIKQFKRSLVENYKRIFKLYLVLYTPTFFKQNTAILEFLIINKYLTFIEKVKFLFVKNMLLKLHDYKGYGLFRLINLLMK